MNPSTDTPPAEFEKLPGPEKSAAPNWREALMALIASRATLAQIEMKDAARGAGRRAGRVGAALFFLGFSWALLLAGGIAAISETLGWHWCWIALAVGGLHLLAGLILVKSAKSPTDTLFPVTRAEFQKDREWIENLHTHPKSNG